MRIDFIDLSKQINHNQKEGANKHSSEPTHAFEFMQGRAHTYEKEQMETQKQTQTTPLPRMNNKLNNKQITLYIYIVISPHQST